MYSKPIGKFNTFSTPVRHISISIIYNNSLIQYKDVRLACVKTATSIHSEPE